MKRIGHVRILKRHGGIYVAEFITSAMLDKDLKSLCENLSKEGVKKSMLIKDDKNADDFDEKEMKIIRESINY